GIFADMCVETMAAQGKQQRVSRPMWSKLKKRRFVYASLVKVAVRKYTALWETKKRRAHRKSSPAKCGWQSGLSFSPDVGLPAGAMAPGNTTQYLMELAYRDLENDIDFSNPSNLAPGREEHFSPRSGYSSLFSDDDSMDFQQRDFENVYFLHEL
ncbi:hypothetical protein NFI96_009912, partial [Prochilodus magdalenae]